jgi:hypothetical protein
VDCAERRFDSAPTIIAVHSDRTAISVEARSRVPMTTPLAPRQSAAANPLPSATPPAATTGRSPNDLDDLRDEHQRADVPAVATGSPPWATMMSAPQSTARRGLLDVHHLLRTCLNGVTTRLTLPRSVASESAARSSASRTSPVTLPRIALPSRCYSSLPAISRAASSRRRASARAFTAARCRDCASVRCL